MHSYSMSKLQWRMNMYNKRRIQICAHLCNATYSHSNHTTDHLKNVLLERTGFWEETLPVRPCDILSGGCNLEVAQHRARC